MAWIESHTQTKRHRKNVAMARDLRLKPVWLMGHLHSLWHTVLEQQEDGDLSKWSDHMIADAADFTGNATQFVELLRKHELLDGARTVHDWLDYAGLYLTRKYASKFRDKLVVIWAKHGRLYGDPPKKPPKEPNNSCNGNQTTSKQLLLAPQEVGLVSSKDSSTMEREHFNRGLHTDIAGQAVRLVALFLTCVKTSHRSTKQAAVNALGQVLIDHPAPEIAAIERGISAYAADCEQQDTPPSKRCSPLKFFEERRWESYDGLPAMPKAKTQAAMSADDITKATS